MADITQQEAAIAQRLGDIWGEYLALPPEHPTEAREFCDAIHRCQDMILARVGRRAFHAKFKTAEDARGSKKQ